MKFIMPNVENEIIACLIKLKSTTMKQCFKCKYLKKCTEINIQQLKDRANILCETNNEIKFCKKVRCDNCDGIYIRTPGGFMCKDCGNLFQPTKKQIKTKLNKEYEEIDYTELNEKMHEIETKIKLLNKLQDTNQEEGKFITNEIDTKNENNIINFKDIKGSDK